MKKLEFPLLKKIGDEALEKKTGKKWEEWFRILDHAGATTMNHADIAKYLFGQLNVPGWWCQMVAAGYEQARGTKDEHQTATGFEISVSKTIAAATKSAYNAWNDEKIRPRWLPNTPIVIHKATANKSMRVTWTDGKKSVDVNFYPKGTEKCQVVVQHRLLAEAKAANRMKSFWSERLDKLKTILEK